MLYQIGISVPRSVAAPIATNPVAETELKSLLLGVKLAEQVQVAPLHVRQVLIDLPLNRSPDDVWFVGRADTSTFTILEGSVNEK